MKSNIKPSQYTMFPKSKPWGYHPVYVEERIKEYETALMQVNNKNIELSQVISRLEETIKRLQDELRDMHLQMANLELPDIDEVVQQSVLNDFKNYNNVEAKEFPDPPMSIVEHDIENDEKQILKDKNEKVLEILNCEDKADDEINIKNEEENGKDTEFVIIDDANLNKNKRFKKDNDDLLIIE